MAHQVPPDKQKTMSSIRAELDNYDFDADTKGVYASKILAIVDHTLSRNAGMRGQKPPLDILVYASKGIVYPSFVPKLMVDFLALITMVEFHRLRILEKASAMLEWHIYYSGKPNPEVHLNHEDEKAIREFMDDSNETREFYIQILTNCCSYDLRRLWMTSSNTDFWVRWDDYFNIFKVENKSKPHSFHYKLSDEEISQLREVATDVLQFMEDTTRYAGEHGQRGQSIQDVFQTSEFQDQLQGLVGAGPDSETLKLIQYYLDYVQSTVHEVKEILRRSSNPSAAS